MNYVKIGVGGPVGSGKTALIEKLTRILADSYSIGVVTNDIYTKEDAEFFNKEQCTSQREDNWSGNRRLPSYGYSRGCFHEP